MNKDSKKKCKRAVREKGGGGGGGGGGGKGIEKNKKDGTEGERKNHVGMKDMCV